MSTVKSRREQYSEETRAAILSAATKRFGKMGFAGTALEDVAADVQATRGAVYHHFANKRALFEAVFDELESAAVRRSADAAAKAGDPWASAFAALDTFLEDCCDPVYGRIVWQEAPLALGWHRWRECEMKYAYGFIELLMSRLMDSGLLMRQPLETLSRITFALLGAAGLALAEASDEDKPRVRGEYAALIGQLVLGLRTLNESPLVRLPGILP
jgi:AcrR family transcriptional regulator